MWTQYPIVSGSLIIIYLQISLGWLFLFMGVLVGSAVVPISLCVFWPKLSGEGMIAGTTGDSIIAFIVWLSVASIYPGGLRDFLKNTGKKLWPCSKANHFFQQV